ncbi:MAG: glycerophosphodiester phosphodiesterase family protein [Candidatus Borkfalkiaceae bacterium]|nr:glycerophosphodiester phosphodiesterase family protein [Christensenellaceae bacterium]
MKKILSLITALILITTGIFAVPACGNDNNSISDTEEIMDTIRIDKKNVLMIAHRGLSGLKTENTLNAFIAAGKCSYYGIETDVHVTKDGKYVISHDENLSRVFGLDVNIHTSTYEELKKIEITDKETGEVLTVPSLREYLDVCKKYNKVSILELKDDFNKQQLEGIIQEVEDAGMSDKIVYISFFAEALKKMRELLPNAKLQFLTGKVDEETINFMLEYNLEIDCICTVLNDESIPLLKQHGIKINCWTVNDAFTAEKLVDLGVDYITTNILE